MSFIFLVICEIFHVFLLLCSLANLFFIQLLLDLVFLIEIFTLRLFSSILDSEYTSDDSCLPLLVVRDFLGLLLCCWDLLRDDWTAVATKPDVLKRLSLA